MKILLILAFLLTLSNDDVIHTDIDYSSDSNDSTTVIYKGITIYKDTESFCIEHGGIKCLAFTA